MKSKRIALIAIFLNVLLIVIVIIFWHYGKIDFSKGINLIIGGVPTISALSYFWNMITGIETQRQIRLKDKCFSPWLSSLKDKNNKYCKIGVQYDKFSKKIIPLKPKEPDDIELFDEIIKNPKKYNSLLIDWKYLKDVALELSKERANFLNEIRESITKEIDLLYWCPHPSLDPDEYLCVDNFIQAIYDEIEYIIETDYPEKQGIAKKYERVSNFQKERKIWELKWGELKLAASPNEDLITKAQMLFSTFIQKKYKEKIAGFLEKQDKIYNKFALKKMIEHLEYIIKSIEYDN